jgi:serine palmitoyltransferase
MAKQSKSNTDAKQCNTAKPHFPQIGLFIAIMTYISYAMLVGVGHLRDFFATIFGKSRYKDDKAKKGMAVLLASWEGFFTRRLYHRVQDNWNHPISSFPGAYIDVMLRESKDDNCTLQVTGKTKRCLNLGSYNYLGFADDWNDTCGETVLESLHEWPIASGASRVDLGTTSLHTELEERVAKFVGKEAAIVFTMGYGTNSTTIPCLMGEGSLLISDSLNHVSLVNGSRGSKALVRVFKHNDPANLEMVLREAVTMGQPRHRRPWKKIMVVIEGIYSMEGVICQLPAIVKVVKKYKAYIYLDEAHSIGALGPNGAGVCEHAGVDPNDIDIMMGTFTKSFGGMGGYIAANKSVIEFLRATNPSILYHHSMSAVVCQQVITAFKILQNELKPGIGAQKLLALRENSNFFRSEMKRLGLHVYGSDDSPIIPVLLYLPSKAAAFSRECLKRGLAVVVVGFPATEIILCRARFCISAGHSREDLEFAVKTIDEVSQLLWMRYERSAVGW